MAEKTKSSSTATQRYFDHAIKVMRENDEFLRNNARETCDEVIELINDAIDYVGFAVKRSESRKDYVERSMVFFMQHILMPFSYAIHVDLLAGTVPTCFMELRFMLESLMQCYLADSRYPDSAFFQEKLESLEQEKYRKKKSTSKLMEELGEELGVERDLAILWHKLSHHWIHTKGIVDRVVSYIVEKSDVPPWALVIPMSYTENDLNTVDELRKRISEFRGLLTTAMEKYQQELGFL